MTSVPRVIDPLTFATCAGADASPTPPERSGAIASILAAPGPSTTPPPFRAKRTSRSAYGTTVLSRATTAEYREVSIEAIEPCVTSTPGATRMNASTFHPLSSRAATTNLDSHPAFPMTRTFPKATESDRIVVPVDLATLPAIKPTADPMVSDTPASLDWILSIKPAWSAISTLELVGAAIRTLMPPSGEATG